MPAESASLTISASPKAASGEASDFTRLHISPLDPELLKIVLPAAVAPKARNISYHTIETFPERRYGYVELPTMDADKLKKKLHGSVLKGTKLRVEKARPEKRADPTGEADKAYEEEEEKKQKRKSKKYADAVESRKRKRDPDLIQGVAITDRKIKRGWTEPADQRRKTSRKDKDEQKDGKKTEKKKRQKSKYTDQDECLLKTTLPPNAVANATGENLPKKRKKKSNVREVTVHEFEKTTKFPSFLKDSVPEPQSKTATEFVEGKGWVDEDGNVVETIKAKPVTKPAQKHKKTKPVVKKVVEEEVDDGDDDSTSSSGTSSSGSSSDEESEEESGDEEVQTKATREQSVSDDDESPAHPEHSTLSSTIKADNARPTTSSSSQSLTIKIPPPITPSSNKVHPLEALYKRANPTTDAAESPKEAQPFSFFGADADNEEGGADQPGLSVPMTPFSRQDLEWRSTRSAAPTPDTAHPSRMRNFWAGDDDEADLDDEVMDDAVDEDQQVDDGAATPGAAGSSEFQSWFWDNRRDLNRSWMNRRKTASKEKRHRDNKARASKAV
ncbi:hypothetical protein EDB81DRAFT_770612 [Dactylonectria macrodidyma]|uniref:Nucleotide-binding, alpha-beta plait n=1 Tax=Dactylonectria macrodidyma TaxID=307937 RepID=A0A9P9FSZ4_9HYPO|nr:hypothetical protein EDB81DRAFT_770612 [Dactylonectria macrodidyma]